jgi:hypothetical protein
MRMQAQARHLLRFNRKPTLWRQLRPEHRRPKEQNREPGLPSSIGEQRDAS